MGLGYSLDAFLLDAKHFVPQSRLRLFVVGVLDSQVGDDPRRPPMEVGVSEIRPVALMRAIGGLSDVRWRLLDLPCPPRTRSRLADIVEDVPADHPDWWARERVEPLGADELQTRRRGAAHAATAWVPLRDRVPESQGWPLGCRAPQRWGRRVLEDPTGGEQPSDPFEGWRWGDRGATDDRARVRAVAGRTR